MQVSLFFEFVADELRDLVAAIGRFRYSGPDRKVVVGAPSAGEPLELAHVPILWEDQFGPFLDRGEDVFGAGNESVVIVQRAPMDPLVLDFLVLGSRYDGCVLA